MPRGIGVRKRLAVDNIRDIGDHTIPPVHRRVEHATRGIATDGERDGEHTIWDTLDCLGQGVCAWVCQGNPATKARQKSEKAPQTLHDPPLLPHAT